MKNLNSLYKTPGIKKKYATILSPESGILTPSNVE
jgi:hypothetical protein